MIIVTGGAGFIGSNLVQSLNERGEKDIFLVDDLSNGHQFSNLVDLEISDYMDKAEFLKKITHNTTFSNLTAIFHQGACSSTTEWDGRYMMQNNYAYSKTLLHYSLQHKIPFIYASSAAVYGAGTVFQEARAFERPLNMYGYSKFLFDQVVRKALPDAMSQVVGLRYFNVYGPREAHKGSMSSVAYHLNKQMQQGNTVKLFVGSDGYADGEQRRDFIYVQDAVDVNLWFYDNPVLSGIYNVGSGNSQSFNDVARSVVSWHERGEIEYIPFPEHLKGCYQSFTEADISALRAAGYQAPFKRVEEGVRLYLDWMNR